MKKRKNLNIWLAMSMFLLLMVSTATAEIIFVDDDATGSNNGSSWEDAYNYLQDALANALSGDEIWVAHGIYKPDQGAGVTPDDRTATFQLISGVTIKGGYAGFGEPDANERDIDEYETILSGDLSGNDGPNFANNDENSYHIVTGNGTDETAVLDGFTITAGNANGPYPDYCGGGMFNDSGSPTLTNCTLSGNNAKYVESFPPIPPLAAALSRWTGDEAGTCCYDSILTPTSSTISRNKVEYSGDWPLPLSEKSSPKITSSTTAGIMCAPWRPPWPPSPQPRGDGGGIYCSHSSPTLTNCIFSGNSAYEHGGGMYNDSNSRPTLTKCTFRGNSASSGGGGENNYSSRPTRT